MAINCMNRNDPAAKDLIAAMEADHPGKGREMAELAFHRAGKIPTPAEARAFIGKVTSGADNPLDDLSAAIRPTAEAKNIPKDADATWAQQAKVIADAMAGVKTTAVRAWKGLVDAQQGRPQWHGTIKPIIGERQEAIGKSAQKAREFLGTAHQAFTAREQEAIADWTDAGGNIDVLQANAAKTTDKYRQGYIDAQNMTPEMLAAAKSGQTHFDKQFAKAYEAGVVEDAMEDYIHRMYDRNSEAHKGAIAEVRSGAFETKPGLAKQRFYQYDADAEAAGLNPVKSWSKRIAAHAYSLDRAIANRRFVDGVFKMKAPDGRPMADMQGMPIPLEGKEGDKTGSYLIPHAKNRKGVEVGDQDYRGDFIPYDHPAFRKRKWMMKDTDGKPIFMQADMMVHPDMVQALDAVLGRSKFLEGEYGQKAKKLSGDVKQTMLGFFSLFHPVQLGIHALEHRVNPFNLIEKVDYDNPQHAWLIRHGLEVHDHAGMMDMAEGTVGGGGFLKHIPKLGAWAGAFQDLIFKHYIPRLKMTMALHALERNKKIYGKELTADEIGYLTASEANQAFGGLNYEMIGRSRTTQDVLRMSMLAPDFFEARARFVGEAFSKYGAEQRVALMLGAGAMYVTARIMNQMLNDDPHLELKNAFNIVVGKRLFGLRTIQGDLIHLVTDPGKFMFNRVNPLYVRTLVEAGTGRDYFGRERTGMQQLGDLAQTVVPIGLRGITNPTQQSLLDSLANSIGFVEKKYHTPAEELAHKISGGRGAMAEMTPDEKKKHAIMTDVREKVAAGDTQAAYKAVRSGDISNADAMRVMKDAKKPDLVRSTSSLPLVHVLEVWDKANDTEKKELKPKIVMSWMRYRKTKTRSEIESMHKELKARGLAV